MATDNPYSTATTVGPKLPPKRGPLWPLLAWAAFGPVAIMSSWMLIPYEMPSLKNSHPFLRGDLAIYVSLIAGFLPAAVVSFELKVKTCLKLVFAVAIYSLVWYGVLCILVISLAGLLFHRYL